MRCDGVCALTSQFSHAATSHFTTQHAPHRNIKPQTHTHICQRQQNLPRQSHSATPTRQTNGIPYLKPFEQPSSKSRAQDTHTPLHYPTLLYVPHILRHTPAKRFRYFHSGVSNPQAGVIAFESGSPACLRGARYVDDEGLGTRAKASVASRYLKGHNQCKEGQVWSTHRVARCGERRV